MMACSKFGPTATVLLTTLTALPGLAAERAQVIYTIDNSHVRIELTDQGTTAAFIDKRDREDRRAQPEAPRPFATIVRNGAAHPVTRMTTSGSRLTATFGDTGIDAVFDVVQEQTYARINVVSISSEEITHLQFGDFAIAAQTGAENPLVLCPMALNLQTNVQGLPGLNGRGGPAFAYPRFGIAGAAVGLAAAPAEQLRSVMQEIVRQAKTLPVSPLGGPWALEQRINRGSYLFNFDALTEDNVDEWIAVARKMGLNQIDFHGGTSFRFGDIEPNPKLYPKGLSSLKAVIDKLHASGISAGLHTYAFFISKQSKWVTPVPDPRLAKAATFTLSEDLPVDAAAVPVEESTEKLSTTTGFFVHNSVTVQIDDELITFGGIDKQPPYRFTSVQRGAWGTRPAEHKKGAPVHHLKETFGLFLPDGDSTLYEEVAARCAEVFDHCGFDMMYLDALDGEGIHAGWENGWHYGSKFVFLIWKHLKHPALMEMSTFHHHLWYVRSRFGAWDHPNRGYKRFIDIHAQANRNMQQILLPGHMGWWAVKTSDRPEVEHTFSDDIEYLCCRALGLGDGISLMGVDPWSLPKTPAYERLGRIIQRYEKLRLDGYFPESIRMRLLEPGQDFTLTELTPGEWTFKPANYATHKVEIASGESASWTVEQPHAPQPVQLRIEALRSAAPYDSPEAKVLTDFADPSWFGVSDAARGIEGILSSTTDGAKAGGRSGVFTATNRGARPPATWIKREHVFDPPIDLSARKVMGAWVHGDGSGAILNLQWLSPEHITRAIYDHYVTLDFRGWRYVEFIEPESVRCDPAAWPYAGDSPGGYHYLMSLYREFVSYPNISSLSIWLNNVPQGKKARCLISPIKALPLRSTKLHHPTVTINGRTLTFPVDIESGGYLEFRSPMDCKLYDVNGAVLAEVKPEGDVPELLKGANQAGFRCTTPDGVRARAAVTVMSFGEPLER